MASLHSFGENSDTIVVRPADARRTAVTVRMMWSDGERYGAVVRAAQDRRTAVTVRLAS
jgi:hypothetical protein